MLLTSDFESNLEIHILSIILDFNIEFAKNYLYIREEVWIFKKPFILLKIKHQFQRSISINIEQEIKLCKKLY